MSANGNVETKSYTSIGKIRNLQVSGSSHLYGNTYANNISSPNSDLILSSSTSKITLSSSCNIVGSVRTSFKSVTSQCAITASQDSFIRANTTTGSFGIELPTAIGNQGIGFTIKRINSGSNDLVISGTSNQLIDGAEISVVTTQYTSLTLVSDGENWMII